jgi:hypothetical protein
MPHQKLALLVVPVALAVLAGVVHRGALGALEKQDQAPITKVASTASKLAHSINISPNARVIWRRPDPPRDGTACGMSDGIALLDARIAQSNLYLNVKYRSARSQGDEGPVMLSALRDGCPIDIGVARGALARRGDDASTIWLPLKDLPDGNIDLIVSAFNSSEILPLKKEGERVAFLSDKGRRGYQRLAVVEGDEGVGETVTFQSACPHMNLEVR